MKDGPEVMAVGVLSWVVLSCVVAAAPPSQRDVDQPTFEAVSVKPNNSATGFNMSIQPGRVRFIGITARQLLVRAYGVEPFDIVGEQPWTSSERFDVIATASTDATVPEINRMLRAFLAERFHVVGHVEKRESPVYFLVVSRGDGRLGPSLKPAADAACDGAAPGDSGTSASSNQMCRLLLASGVIEATGQPIRALGTALGSILERPVVDMTALFGRYDFKLTFTPERASPPGLRESRDQAIGNAPSILTALQEQLGLELQPRREPVDTLIIDRIERPAPD